MEFLFYVYIALLVLSAGGAALLSRLLPLSLSAGAAVALVLSFLADLWVIELLALTAVTVGLFFLFRHLAHHRETPLEAMVGKTCIVTERIDPLTGGQVEVEGNFWAARGLADCEGFDVGTRLVVVAIEGVKLICR